MDHKSNFSEYEESIGKEILGVKNRVRNLIGDKNWQKEGEYKEAILRSMIRQYIPKKYTVGTGFIVGKENEKLKCSKQIDVLIFDSTNYPTILSEGDDFYIVEPDCVRAIIEVKTKIDYTNKLMNTIHRMNDLGYFVYNYSNENRKDVLFVGIFSFEGYEYESYDEKNIKSLVKRIEKLFHNKKFVDYIIKSQKASSFQGHTNYIVLNNDIIIKQIFDFYTYKVYLNPNRVFFDFFRHLNNYLRNYGKDDYSYRHFEKDVESIYEIKMIDLIEK